MIDHFGINCADWGKSQEFYDTVLGVLGYTPANGHRVAIGYGTRRHPTSGSPTRAGEAGGPNREVHVAFHGRRPRRRAGVLRRRAERWVPNRCTSRGCGPNTTRATSAPSSATPTATTSRRSSTAHPGLVRVASASWLTHDADAARELLRDAFTRLIEHVDELTDGLTDEVSSLPADARRPTASRG